MNKVYILKCIKSSVLFLVILFLIGFFLKSFEYSYFVYLINAVAAIGSIILGYFFAKNNSKQSYFGSTLVSLFFILTVVILALVLKISFTSDIYFSILLTFIFLQIGIVFGIKRKK
ncbi:MAG: hypothetical protein QM666_03080 [Acinetobacter sp.]